MTKRMLIDATHAEETRVVVLDGNRLEDFDVETSTKRQLKGNIYLAKVVRVEPSLQACFVEYGGNRHGFLAFSEIHPDYYQIPVADRQRLLDLEAEDAQREEEEADREAGLAQPFEAEKTAARRPHWVEAPLEATIEATVEVDAVRDSGASAEQPETPAFAAPMAETGAQPAAAEAQLAEPGVVASESQPQPIEPEVLVLPSEPQPQPAAPAVQGAAPKPQAAAPIEPAPTVVAETSDESGATAALASDAPTPPAVPAPEASAGSDPAATSGSPENEPQPPAIEASAPQAPIEHPAADDDAPEPSSRHAQPMIIVSETVSGPIEGEDAGPESDGQQAAEPWHGDSDWASPAAEQTAHHLDHESDLTYDDSDVIPEAPPPETVGGEPDSADEQRERRMPPRFLRNYKIQEVIRRRQILLVQVVKEERGTKGAALTTYLSLAGRFSVLMPNSPRGGGISRKITSATDRRRLKEVISELDMPRGMGLIVRTAGANRPKPEIKRDCEYLLRLWDDIREHTLKSVAPALIYEEASLIKRAIRDVYSRDIDEIQVDGEEGWKAAHEFMRMLMPSHAKKVQLWRDPSQPLFTRYQVEAQLDGMLQPTVQLRSGGYLVINQTEALVAIDVNSGRSTRERNVEETALRTNLEAADEVARQLRLRDLAGLIVIDLIDMEAKKHNAMVERRLKEALKNDRARIQVGHISHFGLLEMSRQRLRPSLAETSFILCPHCGGTGHVRSTETAAVHVLRGIEDEGSKRRAAEIVVHVATPTALYILNHKRDRLHEIEQRYGMRVTVLGDDTQLASQYRIDRVRPQAVREGAPAAVTPDMPQPATFAPPPEVEEEPIIEDESDAEESAAAEAEGDEAPGEAAESAEAGETSEQAERRRRRRRRRRGGRREDAAPSSAEVPLMTDLPEPDAAESVRTAGDDAGPEETAIVPPPVEGAADHIEGVPEHGEPAAEDESRRRRSRRGGRRRRRDGTEGDASPFAAPGAEQPELPPVYAGPTPANPFGGQAFDIFDVLEQAEANAAAARLGPPQPMVQQFEPEPGASFAPEPAETPAAPDSPAAAPATAVTEPAEATTDIVNMQVPEPAAEVVAVEPAESTAMAGEAPPSTTLPPVEADAASVRAAVEADAAPVRAAAESDAAPAEAAAGVAAVPADRTEETPAATAETTEPAPAEAVAEATPTEAAAESPPAEVANDVVAEPVIRPIVIDTSDEVVEKKRGWWRR